MIIAKDLAQKIVDHLMEIVERNVNIMDCDGIIIASGQRQRLGNFHQGGKLAVEGQNVVEIKPDEVNQYIGALPGVMWPINIKNKIVGVVGVTGEPHEVSNTAKLVKTVTELILEREMLLADSGSENRLKAQLVDLLFSDNADNAMDQINTLAEMLNYKVNLPRVVILIKLEPMNNDDFEAKGLQNLLSARIRENVLNLIRDANFFTADDISLFYKNNLCIIKSLPNDELANHIDLFIKSVIKMLNVIQPKLRIQIGLGSRTKYESELRQSYDEANFALEYPNGNTNKSISHYEILLSYLFKEQRERCNYPLALWEIKRKFDSIKGKYDMHKTLEGLLANNMNVSATANLLFIHRNTLQFRLEKLEKCVGLDPCHSFEHAMLCKFLLSMDQAKQ